MPLSNEQIKQIVKENRNDKEIQQGIKHQQRLRFHVETIIFKFDLSPYYLEFLDWIGGENPEVLAKDKFDRFKQLIKAPIQTIELTESIYSRLNRVFTANDSFFHYQFDDDKLMNDWAEYRDDKFWPTIGFEAMQTAIDSVWIPELPDEQTTEFPQPVNRLISIEDVLAIENDPYNNCKYVIFKNGGKVYVYDDESFRVFEAERGIIKGGPIEEVKHDLGYTPARMFWSEKLSSRNLINKESPLTKELTDLDWLLFHQTSKRYLDLANAYPTIVSYEADDDYEDDDITANEQRTGNKKPRGNRLMGPGSFITVPPPREGENDMMSNPIKIISPDVNTLNWHVEEEKRLTDKIFKAVVGTDTEVRNDAAKNEKQIDSAFESQKSVLMRIKRNFEKIHKFADYTIAKLRYGERFVDCEIDYGTDFFLKDVEDLQEELVKTKESGGDAAIIESIRDNIISTKYRDDQNSVTRANIISELDPLPGTTVKESIELFKNGAIDKINFIIKSKLINFVKRFERENIDIVKFGSLGTYSRKIEEIQKEFIKYATEIQTTEINKPDEIIEQASGINE